MSMVTLNEFIMERQADFPYASGDLSRLLADISIAAKIINHKVNKAGLQDILGAESTTNVQGETQMKLDVFSDHALLNAVKWGGQVCGAGSEENEKYFA
ncbi:MAG: Fructose,6-bisphosphatase class 1, partial [Bacteroidota bacterium]